MGFMDCDSHVLEVPQTWDHLDPKEEHFRPQIARFEDGAAIRCGGAARMRACRGRCRSCFSRGTRGPGSRPHGAMSPHVNMYEPGMLDLTDPAARVEALDALGIDVQVLFSTFYIGMELDNPLEEAALARSYNRWVGEHLAGYPTGCGGCCGRRSGCWSGRSRSWSTARPPRGRGAPARGGARHVLVRPVLLPAVSAGAGPDPADLDPQRVDHPAQAGHPDRELHPAAADADDQLVNLMCAFHAVLGSDVSQRFPRLRWGFLEGGAAFTLPVLQQHARRDMSIGVRPFLDPRQATPATSRPWTCTWPSKTDEDLPYLAGCWTAEPHRRHRLRPQRPGLRARRAPDRAGPARRRRLPGHRDQRHQRPPPARREPGVQPGPRQGRQATCPTSTPPPAAPPSPSPAGYASRARTACNLSERTAPADQKPGACVPQAVHNTESDKGCDVRIGRTCRRGDGGRPWDRPGDRSGVGRGRRARRRERRRARRRR